MMTPATLETADGPTVEGAGAELLKTLLVELESEIARAGAPVGEFEAGVPKSETRARLAQIGIEAPDEVLIWFAWHNGVSRGPDGGRPSMLLPSRDFWTLDGVIRRRQGPPPPWGDPYDDGPPVGWPPWLEIIGYGRLGIAVSLQSNEPTIIRATTPTAYLTGEHELEDPDAGARHQAVSLCTPVAWWIEAIQSGGLTWDNDTRLWQRPLTGVPRERVALGFV
jgi:hypothetical protein